MTRSSAGMTTSLQTMMLSAVVSTTTMLAAAETPPRKAIEREDRLVAEQRQRQHEIVGIAGARQQDAAGDGDGQDEEIDDQQIERELPERAVEMALVDVLDHHHLELPRQAEGREHGEEGHARSS